MGCSPKVLQRYTQVGSVAKEYEALNTLAELSQGTEHTVFSGCLDEKQNMVTHALRSPLSTKKDEIGLMQEWLRFAERTQPESSQDTEVTDSVGVIDFMFTQLRNESMDAWTTEQSRSEAEQAAVLFDAPLRIARALSASQFSVRTLSELASTMERGVRPFVRNAAWFLRRSCMFRPCNERLERVLGIITTDECFPYANGEYLKEDSEYIEKCAESVK